MSQHTTIKSMFAAFVISLTASPGVASENSQTWELAKQKSSVLRFATLFTAQNVRDHLTSADGKQKAIDWCKDTGVTHVYLETFRDGYTVDREVITEAKKTFLDEGFLVSGCVTTTRIGRESVNGWIFPCFTEQAGLNNLKRIFEFTAGIFDEIMIDDFFATRCECDDCIKARGDRPWDEFRCDMMVDVSRRYVIEPARKVNPDVTLIIKYPQWYDVFHKRGYEVARQTKMFDTIWVGTETRDPDSERWGRKAQYEAYYIMRWLGEVGGEKCGGGWFDPYGTSPPTYVEQARQTILAGAKEALLFCYGSLQRGTGPANVRKLREELPELFRLAELVRGKKPRGISAPKPPNSDADGDQYVYDFIGMLGFPLVPTTEVRPDVPAAFLPRQTLKDPQVGRKVSQMADRGVPLLVTNHLAEQLSETPTTAKLEVLDIPKNRWELMEIDPDRLRLIRRTMLEPLGIEFEAPTRVALYLFGENLVAIENFNDDEIEATVTMESGRKRDVILVIPAQTVQTKDTSGSNNLSIPARTLVVLELD